MKHMELLGCRDSSVTGSCPDLEEGSSDRTASSEGMPEEEEETVIDAFVWLEFNNRRKILMEQSY